MLPGVFQASPGTHPRHAEVQVLSTYLRPRDQAISGEPVEGLGALPCPADPGDGCAMGMPMIETIEILLLMMATKATMMSIQVLLLQGLDENSFQVLLMLSQVGVVIWIERAHLQQRGAPVPLDAPPLPMRIIGRP